MGHGLDPQTESELSSAPPLPRPRISERIRAKTKTKTATSTKKSLIAPQPPYRIFFHKKENRVRIDKDNDILVFDIIERPDYRAVRGYSFDKVLPRVKEGSHYHLRFIRQLFTKYNEEVFGDAFGIIAWIDVDLDSIKYVTAMVRLLCPILLQFRDDWGAVELMRRSHRNARLRLADKAAKSESTENANSSEEAIVDDYEYDEYDDADDDVDHWADVAPHNASPVTIGLDSQKVQILENTIDREEDEPPVKRRKHRHVPRPEQDESDFDGSDSDGSDSDGSDSNVIKPTKRVTRSMTRANQ